MITIFATELHYIMSDLGMSSFYRKIKYWSYSA